MKDHLLQTILPRPMAERLNLAREYLQIYLLRLLHEHGAHRQLGFVGGTALRLLHQLPRFSEDLDFSLEPQDPGRWEARATFHALKADLERAGYRVTVKAKLDRVVESALFRFEGLPQEIGVASDPRLGLSIKLEIDTRPPPGARLEVTLIQRVYPVAVRHHDIASLFAGKLHALLTRNYPKGRDWFDLVWYLTEKKGLAPNLTLLQNALAQSGRQEIDSARWKAALRQRFGGLDWAAIQADMAPFLERADDSKHLQPQWIEPLLG